MGVIAQVLTLLFGGGRNTLRDTVEVFRENAESGALRDHDLQIAALRAFMAEFDRPRKSGFDRFMDAVNRMPRPLLAFGCLALLVAAMIEPVWFAARMQGIALVPEPLWWLLGVIVSFYFGARHQEKGQEFQRSVAETLSRTESVVSNIRALESLSADPTPPRTVNPALAAWRAQSESATK